MRDPEKDLPPATHKDPFHATALQPFGKALFPEMDRVQVIPSYEYAS